jgi:general secretion pathway protein A
MSASLSGPASLQPRDAPMYEEFYGFVQSPFTLAPDPRFLYLSASHDEAIRLLLQAIRRKEGFLVLAGDIGTGKTTLCRALIEQLDQTTFTSLVLNPFVSIEELLKEILLDFGVVSPEGMKSSRIANATKHELISTLHEFLLSLQPIGGIAVLIIDEAQHLTPDVLEQIRVISNLETNEVKLLQIVLVGQLNLLTAIGAADMRQLDQRISLKAMLKPLTRREMEAYIGHRLGIARGSSSVSFDLPALGIIHAYSGGVPRVINLLCDRALMLGAEAGSGVIGADFVRKACIALGLQPSRVGSSRRVPRWALLAAATLLVAALGVVAALFLIPAERVVETTSPERSSPPPVKASPSLPALQAPETTPSLFPAVRPTSPEPGVPLPQ